MAWVSAKGASEDVLPGVLPPGSFEEPIGLERPPSPADFEDDEIPLEEDVSPLGTGMPGHVSALPPPSNSSQPAEPGQKRPADEPLLEKPAKKQKASTSSSSHMPIRSTRISITELTYLIQDIIIQYYYAGTFSLTAIMPDYFPCILAMELLHWKVLINV